MPSHVRTTSIPLIVAIGSTALWAPLPRAYGGYTESFQEWQASGAGSWVEKDLSGSPYNVPANAVVEIAVQNQDAVAEYYGGVRAVGSGLNRYFQLHEAEDGGADWVIMHVQADADSKIECYAGHATQVRFNLLGYWESVTYVEAMQSFKAGADASWQNHDLSGYGVSAGEIAEIVLVNNKVDDARQIGVRTDASGLSRILDIHEAEDGGDDVGSMFVAAAGANARIEVYAEVNADVDFYMIGYWTTAPGTYTEKFVDVGSPSTSAVWEDKDLSADVPAYAVAEFVLENGKKDRENFMGVRQNGSSLSRSLDIQEAEKTAADYARMHVAADDASIVELYHQSIGDTHAFLLVGYWVIPEGQLDDHSAGQEQDAFTESGGETDAELFAFRLVPAGASSTVTQLVFRISMIEGLADIDWGGVEIRVDSNSDGDIGAGETTTVGGAGNVSQAAGTITFSNSFDVTATTNYILRADFSSLSDFDTVTIELKKDDITSADTFSGSAPSTTHREGCFYVESYAEWQSSSGGSWQTVDLSGQPYNVPASAVLEVAVLNVTTGNRRWGGVRAVGSGLNRRFRLDEAEDGGRDIVVLHVQANASSQIQHYAENTADITFALLGFWDCGTYVERIDSFTAGANASWEDVDLSTYGVGGEDIVEIVMTNDNANVEKEAGVRTDGSVLARILDLHEAEGGGADTATVCVRADWDSEIEVYAETNGDITFYHVGYWSSPPRDTYEQALSDMGSPGADATWQDADLSGDDVPSRAVVEIGLVNAAVGAEHQMGVRKDGLSLERVLDLHEAEDGGGDHGRMHVTADASSVIEFYHEDVSESHTFYLTGYWYDCTETDEYTITDLGALVAVNTSASYGMNSDGYVAGADEDASGDASAWYWDGSSLNSLGTLAGGSISEARGINDAGEVVGWSDDASGYRKPFFYDGSMTDLGTVGGRTDGEAMAVNVNGEVVGTVLDFIWPPSNRLAFIDLPAPAYTLPAGMSSLGTLGGLESMGMDINDSGQVVGRAHDASGNMRPFLWEDGSMSDLGTLGGESAWVTHGAMAINDLGEVVGQSYTAGGDAHAFLWLPSASYGLGAGMNDIGTLSSGDWSWAFDINHKGQIVGASNDSASGTDFYAFIWEEGTMSDLNDLIPAASGWTLGGATAINDDGDITGWGVNGSGDWRAFLLTRTCVTSAVVSLSGQGPGDRGAGPGRVGGSGAVKSDGGAEAHPVAGAGGDDDYPGDIDSGAAYGAPMFAAPCVFVMIPFAAIGLAVLATTRPGKRPPRS